MIKKLYLIPIALILIAMIALPASAYVPMYENKYSAPAADVDHTGTLSITTVSHYNWPYSQMTLTPIIAPKAIDVFDGGRIQEDVAKAIDTGANLSIQMRPDGTWDARVTRGAYLLKLTDSDGGRTEYAYAVVSEGYRTDIRFQGRAVSEYTEPVVAQPYLTIASAQYGSGVTFTDVTAIVQGLVAGDSLTISSAGANYNALFGDPTPGIVKQLDITYVKNGVNGFVSVGENTDTNI